nr:immunoglobulin light chain junction region [Macaca mulatta]
GYYCQVYHGSANVLF